MRRREVKVFWKELCKNVFCLNNVRGGLLTYVYFLSRSGTTPTSPGTTQTLVESGTILFLSSFPRMHNKYMYIHFGKIM